MPNKEVAFMDWKDKLKTIPIGVLEEADKRTGGGYQYEGKHPYDDYRPSKSGKKIIPLDVNGNPQKDKAYSVSATAPLKRNRAGFDTGDNLKTYKKCADTHPPMPITVDGKLYHILGGSCTNGSVPEDAEVYVGFDKMMRTTNRAFPWHKGEEFLFHIQDMDVPASIKETKAFTAYLANAILDGKKVFIGCIGGHGRTGTILAILVKEMMGVDDAITYVRNNYCSKAVESSTQVDWLNKHYGITKVKGTKSPSQSSKSTKHEYGGDEYGWGRYGWEKEGTAIEDVNYQPMPSATCIFGDY